MIINNGRNLVRDHYEKHHWPAARRRLLLAFLGICTILTLYIVIGIQVALASSMFVPLSVSAL